MEEPGVVRALVGVDWMRRFGRGLCPRNLLWGEARKGGRAPLRVKEGIAAMAVVSVEISSNG